MAFLVYSLIQIKKENYELKKTFKTVEKNGNRFNNASTSQERINY
jgi:hypothetical protein